MNIPNPPTDNLYKFISISGLLIFLVSFIFPRYLNKEYVLLYGEIKGELRSMENEIESLDNSIVSDDSIRAQIPLLLLHPSLPNLFQKLLSDELYKSKNLRKEMRDLVKKWETSEALYSEIENWRKIGYYGIGCGLILMIIGFALWYLRLQKYQDMILKNEALTKSSK